MSRHFCQFLPPRSCHTLSYIPGPPKRYVTHLGSPRFFRRPSTKNPDKSPLYKFSQLSAVFCPGGFCPFLLLSQYICYNRKLNITLNFVFNMYDKKCISVTSHALDPSLCHKLSRLLGPPPLERDVLYGRPHIRYAFQLGSQVNV